MGRGKKRKHEQNGETSMPKDEMPLEKGTSDTFPSSIRDVLLQFKETIQVKVNTDECIKKLEETVKKLEETVKILEQTVKKLEEKIKMDKIKEYFSIFMEDSKKQPEEVKEDPYIWIQEKKQREESAKVNRCSASSSLRSQLHQSQTTSFHLKFASEMDALVFKGIPILTIEVVLYDGDNPIAPDHHLASSGVELVVVDGEFDGQIQENWSKDEFVKSIMKSRQGNSVQGEPTKVRVKNGKFKLVGGRHRLEGAVIMENSNRKDVKLGAMIVGHTEERVLEGVSNSFRVQEAKTAEKRGKRTTDEAPEDLPRFTGQNSSHARNKKGNGSVGPLSSEPSQYPTQHNATEPEGQGQQHSFPSTNQNFSPMPNQLQRLNAHTAGNGPVVQSAVVHVQQQNTNQQEDHEGQDQQYSVPRSWPINFQNTPDPSSITYPYIIGNCSVGPLPLKPSQYPTQQDITQPESYAGQGQKLSFPSTKQNFAPMLNQLQRTNAHTEGKGPNGEKVAVHLQQQNTAQQEDHGQGVHFAFMPNQQGTHARTAGNVPGGQPVVVNPQQRNTTPREYYGNCTSGQPVDVNLQQQSTTLQENNAGQGQQYSAPNTGPINFQNMRGPLCITYPYTSGKCIVGPLPLEPSKCPTQQETALFESYGSSTQMCTSPCADNPLGEVLRLSVVSADQADIPDESEYSVPLQHAVAAGPGRHSAGSQHWGISQLPRSHPQTGDGCQDDGAILCAPRTDVPAAERTQMDFTQATLPGSQASRHEARLLELHRQRHGPWQ